MSIFEYNEEDVRQVLQEEAYEEGKNQGKLEGKVEGRLEGKIEDILYFLKEKGLVPAELDNC